MGKSATLCSAPQGSASRLSSSLGHCRLVRLTIAGLRWAGGPHITTAPSGDCTTTPQPGPRSDEHPVSLRGMHAACTALRSAPHSPGQMWVNLWAQTLLLPRSQESHTDESWLSGRSVSICASEVTLLEGSAPSTLRLKWGPERGVGALLGAQHPAVGWAGGDRSHRTGAPHRANSPGWPSPPCLRLGLHADRHRGGLCCLTRGCPGFRRDREGAGGMSSRHLPQGMR